MSDLARGMEGQEGLALFGSRAGRRSAGRRRRDRTIKNPNGV